MKVKILAIGGGLASFGFVDALRSNGVSRDDIRVVGEYPKPYPKFKERCQNSGITMNDRLRSDSSATPGNIWGWPTFGMRETYSLARRGRLVQSLKLIGKLFSEPIFGDVYTPKLSQLTTAIDRECERIGYDEMLVRGSVSGVSKTPDGWRVTFAEPDGKEMTMTAEFLHVATGFQGNKHSPDHQHIVSKFGKIYSHVYDNHEHIYKLAESVGGTVVIRGRGIAASRVLERLLQITEKQPKLKVVHLMNSKLDDKGAPVRANRRTQPFNFPKSAFGGHKAEQFIKLEKENRKDFIDSFGQTTTPVRKHWTKLMKQASKRGQYSIHIAALTADKDRIYTNPIEVLAELKDLVGFIDATGLIRDPQSMGIFRTLIDSGDVEFDDNDYLQLSESCEVMVSQQFKSNLFVGGNLALGGPHSPADSFSGINFNGHIVANEVVKRLEMRKHYKSTVIDSPFTSFTAWLKWARGITP